MVSKTLLFLFFTILFITTKVSAYEFENENAKKPKAPKVGNVQTSPLLVEKVYDDEKSKMDDIIEWIWGILPPKPKPKTPPNPMPKVPQNPVLVPKMPPPLNNAPPPPPLNNAQPPPPSAATETPPRGSKFHERSKTNYPEDIACSFTECINHP